MSGYSVDYASLIMDHMYRIASTHRAHPLPYGNLLTHVFQHFQVPLDSEDCLSQPVPIISGASLKTLRFYKTETRGWQHVSDLTPAEATSLKVSLPDAPTASPIHTALTEIHETLALLRHQQDQLQLDIGLLHKRVEALIHLTSLVHCGARLVVPFQTTDIDSATQSADNIIRSTSFAPHFR